MEQDKQDQWSKSTIKKRLFEITAKAVIVNDQEQVLVVRRSKSERTFPDMYDLPGGGLEEGETLDESIAREIKEELDIEVSIGPIIYAFDFKKDYQLPEEKNLIISGKGLRYLCFYNGGEIKLNPEEHGSYEWLSFDEAIDKFSSEGFESDKRTALIKAKEYLELKNSLDGWKRCLADMSNYRSRMEKDREDFKKYCLEDVILELLPVIDNFEMATEHIPDEDKSKGWVSGIMHIKNQMENVLAGKGVEKIEVKVGDAIDPAIHEVIAGENSNEEVKVKRVIKQGYRIGEKVIRQASVEAE